MTIYTRLFWSKGAIISLFISSLYVIPQYLNTKKDTAIEMTTDEVMLLVATSLIIYVTTTVLINILVEVESLLHPVKGTIGKKLSEWREDDEKQMSKIIDNRFAETISKFANSHEGFIKGMYNNYPHNFTSVFDRNDVTFKDLNTKSVKSLYLWRNGIGIDTYLELANELLKLTKKSVYATTYYDNTQFLNEITTNSKVMTWLNSVNDKNRLVIRKKEVANPDFTLFRVHMFKNSEGGMSAARDFNQFIEKVKSSPKALLNYKEKYVSPCDYFYTWFVEGEIRFYGEYIIFDEQIMIKYDEDFGILELYIGDIVKEHASSFKCDAIHFELNKDKMIDLLDSI